jgi:hypothetical protein
LFHGDLTNLFLMEAEPALISEYMDALVTVIAPLNPVVLYLWQEDVEKAVRTVCAERGTEWIDYQVNWKLAAPYCTHRGFTGLDGLIAVYSDYRRTTDQLFEQLPVAKLAIETPPGLSGDPLIEVIAHYRRSGYVEVDAFNAEPYAHRWFEKKLP